MYTFFHCVFWTEIHITHKSMPPSANLPGIILHNWLSVIANIFTCSCLATQCCALTRLFFQSCLYLYMFLSESLLSLDIQGLLNIQGNVAFSLRLWVHVGLFIYASNVLASYSLLVFYILVICLKVQVKAIYNKDLTIDCISLAVCVFVVCVIWTTNFWHLLP